MEEKLHITLKPHWSVNTVNFLDCVVNFTASIDSGMPLLVMTRTAASIPCCEPQDLNVTDQVGKIPLRFEEIPDKVPHVKKGRWLAGRAVSGPVSVRYGVSTRTLPQGYSSSPYFDFRNEEGGANSAGWTFLVLPAGAEEQEYDYTLTWDLSAVPEGCNGVSTLGDGNPVTGKASAEHLAFSYYAMGDLQCWRDEAYPPFAFYWFGKPKYNIEAVAAYTKGLYQYMSAFFEEPGQPYKVFARKDPFPFSGGGTALPGGFMYGYSEAMDVTVESIQNLLSHEMVHNWPHLHGGKEESTWYHEGTAEYYSSVLPYRAGLISLEKLAEQFNKKTQVNYYLNLFRDYTNDEAAKIYWVDRESQRLPYGRGLLYLTNVDAFIREHSGGKHSLDDVVLELLRLDRAKALKGVPSWLETVEKYAGADPRPDYEAMKRGDFLIPRPDSLLGAFDIRKKQAPLLDIGFDLAATFQGERESYPVQGLKPESNAARAGLREGDVFVRMVSRKEILDRKTETVTLEVLRNSQRIEITYLPHGEPVDVWYWAMKE